MAGCGPDRVQLTAEMLGVPSLPPGSSYSRPRAHGLGNLLVCSEEQPGIAEIPLFPGTSIGRKYDPIAFVANFRHSASTPQGLAAIERAVAARVAPASNVAGMSTPVPAPTVATATPRSDMALVPYNYAGCDGSSKTLQVGGFNLQREVQAIQACEAKHGVGSPGTVNCYQALLAAAGGPNLATEPCTFGVPRDPVFARVLGLRQLTGSAPLQAAATPTVAGTQLQAANVAVSPVSSASSVLQSALQTGGGSSVAGLMLSSTPSAPVEYETNAITGRGGILGTIQDVLGSVVRTASDPQVLAALARGGVIRGSVGRALGYQGSSSQATAVAGGTQAVSSGFDVNALRNVLLAAAQQPAGQVLSTDIDSPGELGEQIMADLGLRAGVSVQRPNVTNSPELFRVNSTGARPYLARRVLVDLPDGGIGVMVNVGRLQYGSRELSYAKQVAKRNGMMLKRKGCGGGC